MFALILLATAAVLTLLAWRNQLSFATAVYAMVLVPMGLLVTAAAGAAVLSLGTGLAVNAFMAPLLFTGCAVIVWSIGREVWTSQRSTAEAELAGRHDAEQPPAAMARRLYDLS